MFVLCRLGSSHSGYGRTRRFVYLAKCDLGTIAFAAEKVSNGTGKGINGPSGQAVASKSVNKEQQAKHAVAAGVEGVVNEG